MNVEFWKCNFSIYENDRIKFLQNSINMVNWSGSKQKIKTTQEAKWKKFNIEELLTMIKEYLQDMRKFHMVL